MQSSPEPVRRQRNNKQRKAARFFAAQKMRTRFQRKCKNKASDSLRWSELFMDTGRCDGLPGLKSQVQGFWQSYFSHMSTPGTPLMISSISKRLLEYGSRVCDATFTSAIFVKSKSPFDFVVCIDDGTSNELEPFTVEYASWTWKTFLMETLSDTRMPIENSRIAILGLGSPPSSSNPCKNVIYPPTEDLFPLVTLTPRNVASHCNECLSFRHGNLNVLGGHWQTHCNLDLSVYTSTDKENKCAYDFVILLE
jgi:hypothetical protein